MKNINLFSEQVRNLRLAQNISQLELGQAIGISKQTVNDIERGRSNTTLERAISIANFFNVSLDYLTGRCNDPDVHNL